MAPLTPVRDVAREKGGKSLLAVVDPGVFFCVRRREQKFFSSYYKKALAVAGEIKLGKATVECGLIWS